MTNNFVFSHIIKVTFFCNIIALRLNLIDIYPLEKLINTCLFFDCGFMTILRNNKGKKFKIPIEEDDIFKYESHIILGMVEYKNYLKNSDLYLDLVINYHHLYKNRKYDLNSDIFISYPEFFDNNLLNKLYEDQIFIMLQVINNFDKLIQINLEENNPLNDSIVIKYLLNNLSPFYHNMIKIVFECLSPYKIGTKVKYENESFQVIGFNIDNTRPIIQSLEDKKIINTRLFTNTKVDLKLQ